MFRLVLDANVIVSAFRSRLGASFALLGLIRHGAARMVATPPLFLEYEEVLKRPDQIAVTGLSEDDLEMALGALAALIEPVETFLSWRPQLADPDDEMVLEAAINARADALVTHNLDHFRAAAPRFGLRLARPADILREVRTQ